MRTFLKRLLLTALSISTLSFLCGCSADSTIHTDTGTAADSTDTAALPAEPEETTPQAVYDPDFRVTAYLITDNIQSRLDFDDSHLNGVTDIILIGNGARFYEDGTVKLDTSTLSALQNLRMEIKDLPIRIHMTLFGPTITYPEEISWENMMDMQAKVYNQAFNSGVMEQNIRTMLETYGLDGVFFDWEYPIGDIHKKWFGEFLVSLDKTLGDDFVIGCAISDWCASLSAKAIEAIDMVELMSYDLWDENGYHATYELAMKHVDRLLSLGYDPSQIDLGIPFYARPTTQEASWYGYKDYYDQLDEDGIYYEESTGLKHSFNTYDTVYKKTASCIERGLGGVMVWHYACDTDASNAASLFNAIASAKADANVK